MNKFVFPILLPQDLCYNHYSIFFSAFQANSEKCELIHTKYSVGYPQRPDEDFVRQIIEAKDRIYEVYFSLGSDPNGRSPANAADTGEMPWETQKRQLDDLARFTDAGIPLNLLLNGNCYGADAMARSFFIRVGETLDWLTERFSVRSVTTTSPLIGKFLHENFEGMEVRASVNMGIGEVPALDYVSPFFDGYYLKREYNRNLPKLLAAKEWCEKNGKKLYMLANSGCLNDCSAHTFHDNLVSHEAEIAKRDNAYAFTGVCRDYLKNPDKRASLVCDMNYVRPEDMHLYEGLFTAAKLATRVNRNPGRVLASYLNARYVGPVTDLLEPDNGSAILPDILDNSLFPAGFGEKVRSCAKNCAECGYCKEVYESARVTLEGDVFVGSDEEDASCGKT